MSLSSLAHGMADLGAIVCDKGTISFFLGLHCPSELFSYIGLCADARGVPLLKLL